MPTNRQSRAIPDNARLVRAIEFHDAETDTTVRLTHWSGSNRRQVPMGWIRWTQILRDGTVNRWGEQRTGRRLAGLPKEIEATVAEMRAEGASIREVPQAEFAAEFATLSASVHLPAARAKGW